MLFTVTVMHNVTRQDGRLAILVRGTANRLLPGDTLKVLGVLAVPATSLTDAAEAARHRQRRARIAWSRPTEAGMRGRFAPAIP